MSVPLSERREGTLQVLNYASQLVKYTLLKCGNEKVFPKKQRWLLASKVAHEGTECYSKIRRANSILVRIPSDFEVRRKWQNEARGHLMALISLLDVAYTVYNIEVRVVEYWTGLVYETDRYLTRWMNADLNRYGNLIRIGAICDPNAGNANNERNVNNDGSLNNNNANNGNRVAPD